MKLKLFIINVLLSILCIQVLASCSLLIKKENNQKKNPIEEYMPVRSKKKFKYLVIMEKREIERVFQWKEGDEVDGLKTYSFTDGKGYTKSYAFTGDALLLKGISFRNSLEPDYYKGQNPCLKMPLEIGTNWEINAVIKAGETRIHQTGRAEIVGIEEIEVKAGKFQAINVKYNIISEYKVKKTGEKSKIPAEYNVWYGKGAGLVKQRGTARIEKENRSIIINQELIEIKNGD
jgi:hypothetical protein